MKNLLLIAFTSFSFFSCSKPNDTVKPTDGSIQYKVNGTFVVMNNIDSETRQSVKISKILKGDIFTYGTYALAAIDKPSANYFSFQIVADNLGETNYHNDSTSTSDNYSHPSFSAITNTAHAVLMFNADYFDVNISSYQNGRITGTFTARYTPLSGGNYSTYGVPGSVSITEGKINNVAVTY